MLLPCVTGLRITGGDGERLVSDLTFWCLPRRYADRQAPGLRLTSLEQTGTGEEPCSQAARGNGEDDDDKEAPFAGR